MVVKVVHPIEYNRKVAEKLLIFIKNFSRSHSITIAAYRVCVSCYLDKRSQRVQILKLWKKVHATL